MPNQFVRVRRNDFPRLMREMPEAVANGIEAAAREGEAYVKRIISESPPTGHLYTRTVNHPAVVAGGNIKHYASEPGNPPRMDTGNHVNSINIKKESSFVWSIRSGAEYSADLEYGTSKMAARPYMGPMAFWLEQQIDDIIGEYIRDVVE